MAQPEAANNAARQALIASLQAADRAANADLGGGDPTRLCRGCNQKECETLRQQQARNKEEQDQLALARAAYGNADKDDLPDGYRFATEEELQKLGLSDGNTNLLKLPDESGFNGEAFVKTDPVTGAESYVIGFKGTDPTSLGDWENNFGQGMGNETSYYRQAKVIGAEVRLSGQPVSFVGHSLGGGLAATASGASGLPAQTFNAAGLSSATLDRLGFENPSLVKATHVQGDILNGLQDNTPIADAFGTRRSIPPAANLALMDMLGGLIGSLIGGVVGGIAGTMATRGVRLHLTPTIGDALKQEQEMIKDQMEEKGCPG